MELTKQTQSPLALAAARIDAISSTAMEVFKNAGSFEAEIQVALAVKEMRAMLTPQVMEPIMALMNTDLGFRTDHDPNQINPRTNEHFKPYPVEVVREVFIESRLRGFHTVGNEFNIIAGRFYACKNGFRRKLTDGKTFPTVRGFRDFYEVPRMVGDKGALVKCRAEWIQDGVKQTAEFEFAVKVNAFMGVDAVVGKAERKLTKRVHDLIAGLNTPDGDIDDAGMPAGVAGEEAKPANATAMFSKPQVSDTPAAGDPTPAGEESLPPAFEKQPPKEKRARTPQAEKATPVQARVELPRCRHCGNLVADMATHECAGMKAARSGGPQEALAALVEREGYTLAQVVEFSVREGFLEADIANKVKAFEDIPEQRASFLLRNRDGLLLGLKALAEGKE